MLSRSSRLPTAQVEGHLEEDDDYEAMCDITATVRPATHRIRPPPTLHATQFNAVQCNAMQSNAMQGKAMHAAAGDVGSLRLV